MREYSRGTFELGGTTDVVREVTGRAAEDFETIARRYAASDPMTHRSVPNLLRAMAQFAKILLTPAPDLERWERESGLPMIDATMCADNADWRGTHDVPGAFGVGEREAPVALSPWG